MFHLFIKKDFENVIDASTSLPADIIVAIIS